MKIDVIPALLIVLGTCFSSTLANDDNSNSSTADSDVAAQPTATVAESDPAGADTYLLRYKFRKGEVLRYESTSASEASVTRPDLRRADEPHSVAASRRPLRQTDQTHVRQIRRFEVTRVDDDGQADMQMRFETVEMSLTPDDSQPIIYKSTMPASKVPRTFALVADRLRRSAPKFQVAPTGAPLDADGELVGADTDESETRLLLPLPDSAVQIDESWKYYNTVKLRVAEDVTRSVRLLTSCRLKSVEGDTAKISFRTSVVSSVKTPSVKAMLIKALPTGHVLLDMNSGRITERVVRNDESVFGVYGPGTLITLTSHTLEKLLPPEPVVSSR